jgi:mannosyltransferase
VKVLLGSQPRPISRGLSVRARGAVFVFGLALVLAGSWRPAWSRDEAATVMVVRRPLEQVWRTWAFDPALEPFYLMVDVWAVVSTSEFWLRLPTVLATAATLPVLATLVCRFCGPVGGTAGALLFVLLPATSRYGQEARPYALTMLVATSAVLVWVSDRAMRGWARHLRLVVLLIVLGLLHAYALVLVLVLLTVALLAPESDRRREIVVVLRAAVLTVVALIPFLWLVGRRAVGAPNPADLTAVNVAVELVRLPVGVLRPPAAPVAGGVILVLAGCGVVVGWWRGGRSRCGSVLAASWLVMPAAVLCLGQAAIGTPGLVARYWTYSLPAVGLAGAFVVQAVWFYRRVAAATILLVVALLGLPTQLAIRAPNGHSGAGWRQFPELLKRSELSRAAVLVEGSAYRALVTNQPALADRMPLAIDPAPTGRIYPQIADATSAQFRRMASTYDVVVVLQSGLSTITRAPTARDFVSFRAELSIFAGPAVLCSFYGDPLGVFSRPTAPLSPSEADHIADLINAVDPGKVACARQKVR